MVTRILVIEDDETIRETVSEVLAQWGFEVEAAADGATGLKRARSRNFELILLDLRLPDMNGLDVLRAVRQDDDNTVVVVMTAYPEVRTAVSAVKAGAYDYLNKPFDLDDLKDLVARALETRRLRAEVERLQIMTPPIGSVDDIVGGSPAFTATLDMARKIATGGRTPVLIRGETGTGKEGVARLVHAFSPRAKGPWVPINCSAIAENLLESELFGHEKGAFTDAKATKRGLIELAHGGTLFLDEIGDLAPFLQPKLLRVIEGQTFRRVGGHRELNVDVRFVAATNRDLEAMVRQGAFREDLYYRLNVAPIELPPLRARRSDVIPLAEHFAARAATMMRTSVPALDPAVGPLLESYTWPGNVRELRNVIERGLILSGGESIRAEHLPKEIVGLSARGAAPGQAPAPATTMTLAKMERWLIEETLTKCDGNKTVAARKLGISRLTLREKIKRYATEEAGAQICVERGDVLSAR